LVNAAQRTALEPLTNALAIKLVPIRVNIISPGWVRETTFWDGAGEEGEGRLRALAERLPSGRNGRPANVAEAFLAVLKNDFMTGTSSTSTAATASCSGFRLKREPSMS
jgi:NAD(P)-dependent dehydrogenase (short-subunit alcohol dehydrogenase family)